MISNSALGGLLEPDYPEPPVENLIPETRPELCRGAVLVTSSLRLGKCRHWSRCFKGPGGAGTRRERLAPSANTISRGTVESPVISGNRRLRFDGRERWE